MLRESLKKDFLKVIIPLETDSVFYNSQIIKDINENNQYKMLFRYRIEFLFPKENILNPKWKMQGSSSHITMSFHSNYQNTLDTRKFNGNRKFSGEFALKGDVLLSQTNRIMVNVPDLLFFIASKTGIISKAKKESRKEKMLRTITKDVYHIDEKITIDQVNITDNRFVKP